MLNLISKASPRTARRLVKIAAKAAEKLGATVRQDRNSASRYFIQTDKDHYIISARSKKKREVETVDGSTYRAHHAGYMSFYKELATGERMMWDIPQREEG
tara:strand:+ start:181 stop:483 length:303 start_codon:yes stop_codon:yes gene_type:complete